MKIFVEKIDNPDQKFWIWKEKITNKQDERIYPATVSNVGSKESVAVYQENEDGNATQIAQLQLPDYKKLSKYYSDGKKINLNYTYIDDFTWLGDQNPYEAEGQPYQERKYFTAQCAIFYNNGNEKWLHFMRAKILKRDLDFSYSGFIGINLDFDNVSIEQGNLEFNNAHFFDAQISFGEVTCGGNSLFSSEISFRYVKGNNVKIDSMVMTQKLSVDFLCAQLENSEIFLDPLPSTFNEICLVKAKVNKVKFTNAEIDTLDIRKAKIELLKFERCKFLGLSEIAGEIRELQIRDCLNYNVFKISLNKTEKLAFFGTVNNGKFCIREYEKLIDKIAPAELDDIEQLLMLKENFRQTGEYENEDISHFYYQKMKTKQEHNIFKKVGHFILNIISGYGTKPFRMLITILIMILFFGVLYYTVPCFSYYGANTLPEHIYTSGITFFTVGYGDLYPLNLATKVVSLVEAFFGVTATSYFLVVLSRKVIR